MTSHSSELRFIKGNMQRQEIAQQIVSQFTVREASVGIISAWSTCLLATSKAKSPWTPKINLRIALIKIFLQLLKLKNEWQQLAMCCWIMHRGSRSDFSEESFFFSQRKVLLTSLDICLILLFGGVWWPFRFSAIWFWFGRCLLLENILATGKCYCFKVVHWLKQTSALFSTVFHELRGSNHFTL